MATRLNEIADPAKEGSIAMIAGRSTDNIGIRTPRKIDFSANRGHC
jgi:hypothetical protein